MNAPISDTWVLIVVGVHAFATLALVGLIWFVQVVHYPLFARVGAEGFRAYEAAHQRRTTLVVGPLMLAEAATACLLALTDVPGVPRAATLAGLGLVVAVWALTAAVQVPLHRRLEAGFDRRAWERLVATNWWRTGVWTVRGVLAIWIVVTAATGANA